MAKSVNVAVQLLPKSASKHAYDIVDAAIAVIANSGVKYRVCPFETVMEGPYEQLMQIVSDIQLVAFEQGAEEVIVNLKIQHNATESVTIEDKVGKYDA